MKNLIQIIVTVALMLCTAAPSQAQFGKLLNKAKEAVTKEKKEEPKNQQEPEKKKEMDTKAEQGFVSPTTDKVNKSQNSKTNRVTPPAQPAADYLPIDKKTQTPEQPWEIATQRSLENMVGIYLDTKGVGGSVTATFANGVLTIKGKGEMKPFGGNTAPRPWGQIKDEIKSIVIEEGIVNIGDNAFLGCSNVESIKLPKSLLVIGTDVFTSCTSLKTINIPAKTSKIAGTPFVNCLKLTAINVDKGNEEFTSEKGVLFNKSMQTLKAFPGAKGGDYTVPKKVEIIDRYAFAYNTGITNIILAEKTASINSYAFMGCTGLQSFTYMYPNPTSIDEAFNGVDISQVKLYVSAGSINKFKSSRRETKFADWNDFQEIIGK